MATVPTVYFIDDSATMREVIKIAFRRENINVLTCHDAVMALEEIEKTRPDIVITDVIMPVKDGYEVCQFIKNHPELSKTPVVLMSGVVNRAVAERAFAVKADELLRKPFQPQDLISRVRNLLLTKGAPRTTPAVAVNANAALSSIFSPPASASQRPVTSPAIESAMTAIMGRPSLAMATMEPEPPVTASVPAMPAMAVASPFSVVVPDVDPLLEVPDVVAKEPEPKVTPKPTPTPSISPAMTAFTAAPAMPLSSFGATNGGSNVALPGAHGVSIHGAVKAIGSESSRLEAAKLESAKLESSKPESTKSEFTRPGIEISRLEGLVKKLQAELQAEREYSRALEAHIKTLQESE